MKRTLLNWMGTWALVLTGWLAWTADSPSAAAPAARGAETHLSPTALAATSDGRTLYVACATAGQIAVIDTESRQVKRRINMPDSPLGLALSSGGAQLFVTCAAPESTVCIVETSRGKVIEKLLAGHTAQAPVLSFDGKTLYVCCRFNNCVSVFDLATKKKVRDIPVPREPVAAALTLDGKHLLVANHIHAGRSDGDVVASTLSVIDLAAGKVVKDLAFPNGSTLLREVRVSPDGKYACVAHTLGRFHLPTTQIERAWINSNALTLIDLAELKIINTVLLDNIDSGAANPWAVAWTADSKTVCVTHAGTHELSVIDFPALLAKLARLPSPSDRNAKIDYSAASRTTADVPNDLSFLVGVRRRIKLTEDDRGPRALLVLGTRAWLANYFTDTVSVIALAGDRPRPESIPVGPRREMSAVRKGEFYFNDASICFQGWQSCASCHSHDARVDGLNWDQLNDGIGNPKNVKSLLFAHQTPPSMALGVRSNAFLSVRMGIKNSLFTVQPPEVAESIDQYLMSLNPIPSPYLVKGKLSPAAQRGKKLFFSEAVGCADCHKGALFTDMKRHDVGTLGRYDKPGDVFDTPTLIEVWRTAPYLHNGSAATVRDAVSALNPNDDHGLVKSLTNEQIDDLVAYVLSL